MEEGLREPLQVLALSAPQVAPATLQKGTHLLNPSDFIPHFLCRWV